MSRPGSRQRLGSSGVPGKELPRPSLHASVGPHMSTELAVLGALIDRSKFQHRSQPFLQRMREVARLGKRVHAAIHNDASEGSDGHDMLRQLLPKFVHALLKAALSTQQIIELEHFLPTHIPVMAIYGRLFALSAHLGQYLDLDVNSLLGGPAEAGPRGKGIARGGVGAEALPLLLSAGRGTVQPDGDGFDFGQKIERPVRLDVDSGSQNQAAVRFALTASANPSQPTMEIRPDVPSSPSASASPPRMSQDSPDPDFPSLPLVPPIKAVSPPLEIAKPKKKRPAPVFSSTDPAKIAGGTFKKKKKARNDIDDIFGF